MATGIAAIAQSILDVLYFRSPTGEMLLYLLFALVSVGALAGATAIRRGLVGHSDGRFARFAARVAPAYPYIVLQAGVVALIGLEAAVELRVTEWLGWDFTPWVYAIEGRATEHFQRALHESAIGPVLDRVLTLVYSWGAFLLFQVPFFFLVFSGRVRSVRRLSFTLAIVWIVGIVFYLFVPVYEVWVTASPPYNYVTVHNIFLASSPGLADSVVYRVNINNNFPSLHTAVTTAAVLALFLAREKWLFRVTAPIAAGVVFATVYLGIHWFVDLVAGLALAAGAAWLVHVRERKRESVPEPRAEPASRDAT